jgi:hypothetical protein
MDGKYRLDRKDEELGGCDHAWMNDRSWMEKETINRNRSKINVRYRECEYFESGLPRLMARHPLICSFLVIVLGGLCFLVFSLIYL